MLSREQQDTALADDAAALVRGFFEFEHVSLTLEQARDVLQQEKAAGEPPKKGRPGPSVRGAPRQRLSVRRLSPSTRSGEPFDDLRSRR